MDSQATRVLVANASRGLGQVGQMGGFVGGRYCRAPAVLVRAVVEELQDGCGVVEVAEQLPDQLAQPDGLFGRGFGMRAGLGRRDDLANQMAQFIRASWGLAALSTVRRAGVSGGVGLVIVLLRLAAQLPRISATGCCGSYAAQPGSPVLANATQAVCTWAARLPGAGSGPSRPVSPLQPWLVGDVDDEGQLDGVGGAESSVQGR
jgi:hypothetical protein